MSLISLGVLELMLAAMLVLALAGLAAKMRLGVTQQLIIAAIRTTVQLFLIGLVLKSLFEHAVIHWILIIAVTMLAIASWEVLSRQKRKLRGWFGFGAGAFAMFISSFLITVLALLIIVRPDPWYAPQYMIPLLGMLLGNTMNGIALGMDRLIETAWRQRLVIEQRLMLGQTGLEAIDDIRRDSMRAGMIPIINAMAAAGIVSLPGMMTGQILAGSPPVEAVKYQILIMFLITAGTGFGVITVLHMISRRMFDDRERLQLQQMLKQEG